MSTSQAEDVMVLAVPKISTITDDYKINFSDPSDTYPEVIYNIMFVTVRKTGLKWIEDNKPQAWFKPMFE